MQSFDALKSELERQGKGDKLRALAESEDGQRINEMLDAAAVENAARTGDADALKKMLAQVLATAEGKRLAASVETMFGKK